MITEKELLAKKKEIENTKAEINQLKGKETTYLEQLKETWKCPTLKKAKDKLQAMKKELEELEQEIEEKSLELEQEYFTNED